MKKFLYSFAAFILGINIVNAKQVDSGVAQQVAENFIRQNTTAKMKAQNISLALSYTEKSAAGAPDYYVFGINNNTGFIIVSAEDAGHPIIGYSTEGGYQIPSATSNCNFNYWMQKRKTEIEYIRDHNLQATAEITNEWTNYATNNLSAPHTMSTPIGPFVQSTWDQYGGGTPAYNSLCPGGSMTGCNATTMSQIMRYWKYPAHGTGSHSYVSTSYGTLSVNFSTETYNWTAMSLTSSSAGAAQIAYDCGVSVDMHYAPASSGSLLCGASPSAEYSYPTYFGYDPGIHCEDQSNYSDAGWIQILKEEFNYLRPVQYQGIDASAGGHTWICDGNDASDKMHMNWGWAGAYNGYFAVTLLNPNIYLFTTQEKALFYIQPLGLTGVSSINSSDGFTIYPNPVSTEFTIEGTSTAERIHYTLYNIVGAEVRTGDIATNGNNFTGKIKVSDISRGMYFIKVSDEKNTWVKKLDVQ